MIHQLDSATAGQREQPGTCRSKHQGRAGSARRQGFTLIELLVVLAVVGILAGLLLPVLARARENGRRAACQSNLRQIGLGLQQYTQDWDEILIPDWFAPDGTTTPGTTQSADTPQARYKWMDAVYPYIRSTKIFTCPSATGSRATPWVYYKDLPPNSETDDFGSYVIMHGYGPTLSAFTIDSNCTDCTPPVSHPLSNDLVRLSQVQTGSTTAWVLDGETIPPPGESTFYAQYKDGQLGPVDPRHLDMINVLFLDGHVKAIRRETLEKRNSKGIVSMATVQDD